MALHHSQSCSPPRETCSARLRASSSTHCLSVRYHYIRQMALFVPHFLLSGTGCSDSHVCVLFFCYHACVQRPLWSRYTIPHLPSLMLHRPGEPGGVSSGAWSARFGGGSLTRSLSCAAADGASARCTRRTRLAHTASDLRCQRNTDFGMLTAFSSLLRMRSPLATLASWLL